MLPTAGNPISMSQIAAELGISATGLSLNDSRVRTLAGKTSGAISMADLYGKSAAGLVAFSGSLSAANHAANTSGCTATVAFNTDGTISGTPSGGFTASSNSLSTNYYAPTAAGIGSSYWIRATVSSGSTPTGSGVGTWLQLSAVRSWAVFSGSGSSSGSVTSTVTFDIAATSGGTILKSGSITISASHDGTA